MKISDLEPGILQVFKLFVAFRTAVFFIGTVISLFFETERFFAGIDLLFWLSVIDTPILFIYLFWNLPRKKLGRFFFPIAIIITTAGTLLESYLYLVQQTVLREHIAMLFQPFVYLFLPLVLVAWQYGLAAMVAFSFGAAFFDLMLRIFQPITGTIGYIHVGLIFARTVAFLFVGYIVGRLVSLQRAQKQALTDANQALEKANIRLVQHAATIEHLSINQERIRMARELHDVVAHTLSGLAVQLDAVTSLWQDMPPRAEEMLQQALDTTRNGLDETRRAMQNLRASPLEEMGLSLAVRSLAEDAAERASFKLNLEMTDLLEGLPVDVEQGYYRIAQEALENIIRHANASLVTIKLGWQAKCLVLEVSDDGIGFNPLQEKIENRFGILGMQERANLIGARWEVSSQKDQGTTVRLEWEKIV